MTEKKKPTRKEKLLDLLEGVHKEVAKWKEEDLEPPPGKEPAPEQIDKPAEPQPKSIGQWIDDLFKD